MTPHATALAAIHTEAFDDPWGSAVFADLLAQAGVFAIGEAGGFILCRVVADEAEILTLVVRPSDRRRGLGRRLVEAAAVRAAGQGATRLFLEVAADNAAAQALYGAAGFVEVGRRRAYYRRIGADDADALILALILSQPLPTG